MEMIPGWPWKRIVLWGSGLFLVFCFVAYVYRVTELILDFRAYTTDSPGAPPSSEPTSWPVPPKYVLPLIENLGPPATMAEELRQLLEDVEGPKNPQRGREKIKEFLSRASFSKDRVHEILQRLHGAIASFPTPFPAPTPAHFTAPLPNFRAIRDASRFWAAIVYEGFPEFLASEALLLGISPAVVALHMENLATKYTGATLIARMIGAALRKLAGRTLADLGAVISPSKADGKFLLALIERMETSLPKFSATVDSESRYLGYLGWHLQKEIENGNAISMYGRNPVALSRALNDKKLIAEWYSLFYSPTQRACEMSYPKGRSELSGFIPLVDDYCNRTTTPGWHWFGYLARPDRFFVDKMFGIAIPNFPKAYEQDVQAREFLRGGATAVAIHAYHQEVGTWPASLSALSKWLERTIPEDLCADESLTYSLGPPPRLTSVGLDCIAGTKDDLEFMVEVGVGSESVR